MVALILLFLVLLVIPCIITFIYLIYYNHQINKSLNTPRKHRLLVPVWIFVITFVIEVTVLFTISYIGTVRIYNQKIESEVVSDDSILYIHTKDEIENSIYATFNGEEVAGYNQYSYQEDQYTYTIYHNNDDVDSISPYYIIYIQYDGNYNNYDISIDFEWNETVSMEGSNSKEYYIIFNDKSDIQVDVTNGKDELAFELDKKVNQ